MATEPNDHHVEVAEGDEVVAFADVEPIEDRDVVRAALHVQPGHLPTGTRTRLVDAVLDLPEARKLNRLEATVPMGDTESLERLRERCEDVETRRAGATLLLDGTLRSDAARTPEPPTEPGEADHDQR